MIKYAAPHILPDDVRAVVNVMYSGWLTQGEEVPKFEKEVAKYVGAKYAVAFNSATSALYASYKAVGMGEGTEVVTTPLSYVATANAMALLGARIFFQDHECLTGEFVVPVHFSGRPYKFYGERVVEDACHALGSVIDGKKVGSCARSSVCVFSTHAIKNVVTGEGGISTTNSADLADFLRAFRSHGFYKDGLRFPGFNFRMTEFQAALGRSQLKRIDSMRDQRQQIVDHYNEELAGYVKTPEPRDEPTFWHLYEIHLKGKTQRDKLAAYLKRHGIQTRVHYKPIYLEQWYQEEGWQKGLCPKAEQHWATELSLPLHNNLTVDDVDKVIDCVKRGIR
jgi:dTDP-4-amino-4,6-dideoxygalactose transaminase